MSPDAKTAAPIGTSWCFAATAATPMPSRNNADTTITLSGPDFLMLTSGNGKPTTMFISGKLRVRGDLGLAALLAKLFVIPTS